MRKMLLKAGWVAGVSLALGGLGAAVGCDAPDTQGPRTKTSPPGDQPNPNPFPTGFPTNIPIPPTNGLRAGTSDYKIMKDLQDRLITRDQAWVRQLEARFNSQALPQKYRPDPRPSDAPAGAEEEHSNPQLVAAAIQALPDVSLETQRAMLPYLLPPSSAESFWNHHGPQIATRAHVPALAGDGCPSYGPIPEPFPDDTWVYSDDTFFRFWYRKNDESLGPHAAEMQQVTMNRLRQALYTAKNRYDTLLGIQIPSDAGPHAFIDRAGVPHTWCDGGNGKLDIYITAVSDARGVTVSYPSGCNARPSFILIDARRPSYDAKFAEFVIAHELFHVYQFAMPRRLACEEYVDSDEGVANWAAHYVFPGNDTEHEYDSFTRYPSTSLLNADYATWPFYLGMVQKHGVGIIPQLYAAEAGLNPYRALKQVLPGGFEKNWPEYSLMGWNQAPRSDLKDWDHFDVTPIGQDYKPVSTEVKLDGRGEYVFEKLYPLGMGLTRAYERFKIDPKVKTLTLSWNRGGAEEEDFHVRALIKRDGSWKVEEWDPKSDPKHKLNRTFCFDDPNQGPIQDLVLAFSRSDIEAPFGMWSMDSKIRLRAGANNMPCYQVSGTGTLVKKRESGTPGGDSYELRTYKSTYQATFRARRDSDGQLMSSWEFVSGNGGFTFSGRTEELDPCATGGGVNGLLCRHFELTLLGLEKRIVCTASASGSFTTSPQLSMLNLDPYTRSADHSRRYGASIMPLSPRTSEVSYSCTQADSNFTETLTHPPLQPNFLKDLEVDGNGKMTGSTVTSSGETITWEFSASQ